jgi:hypothetical protein
MRKDPVNSFTHPIFYRAFHSGSGGFTPEGHLRARLYPPPHQPNSAMLKKHVENHRLKYQKVDTPLISITSDALRAFHVAARYANEGKVDVTVVVIDGRKLQGGTFEPCNELRLRLGLSKENLYSTETLVWGQIPHQAILFRWRWCELQESGLLDLFPRLGEERHLKDARIAIQAGVQAGVQVENEPLWYAKPVEVLVTGLHLHPSSLVTKQISLVMAGWLGGFAEIKFHNMFLERKYSVGIDAELHKKAIMKEKERDFKDWWMERELSAINNFIQERPEPRLSFF